MVISGLVMRWGLWFVAPGWDLRGGLTDGVSRESPSFISNERLGGDGVLGVVLPLVDVVVVVVTPYYYHTTITTTTNVYRYLYLSIILWLINTFNSVILAVRFETSASRMTSDIFFSFFFSISFLFDFYCSLCR